MPMIKYDNNGYHYQYYYCCYCCYYHFNDFDYEHDD